MPLLLIDTTIPLWGIITLLVTLGLPLTWAIITMWFNIKQGEKDLSLHKESHKLELIELREASRLAITKLEQDMFHQEKFINGFKKDIEEKLDRHKLATDTKLNDMNELMVETKTLVKLLVDNKLK